MSEDDDSKLYVTIDLMGIRHAMMTEMNTPSGKVKCVTIPVTDAMKVVGGEKFYVSFNAIPIFRPKYRRTHYLLQMIPKEAMNKMTEEDRVNLPMTGYIGFRRSKEERMVRKINHEKYMCQQVKETFKKENKDDVSLDELPF
ncbi:MAG: hypothetical protein ACI4TD_01565 [Phocaeicola sp.]